MLASALRIRAPTHEKRKRNRIVKAFYHLPGLFEFYELYRAFLPLYRSHREYFYDWCEIGYGVSSRLTFSNSLLRAEHLSARNCNALCALFEKNGGAKNGVILTSELLLAYLRQNYPGFSFVSSTTKVLTAFEQLEAELGRAEFDAVVPDFRLNKAFDRLFALPEWKKQKLEFLCNECCDFACGERRACYENVSRKNLGENCADHVCASPAAAGGYRFSAAMKNPGFIGIDDIRHVYLPNGFSHFKIEGRSLGSAIVLEFLLYYLTKPEYRLNVREEIYLDSALDLF